MCWDASAPDFGARLVLNVVRKSALVNDPLDSTLAWVWLFKGGTSTRDFGTACPGGISEANEPLRGPELGVLASDAPSKLEILSFLRSGCVFQCPLLVVALGLIEGSTSTSIVLSSIASRFDGVADSDFATRGGMTASWEILRLALGNDWTLVHRHGASNTGIQHIL